MIDRELIVDPDCSIADADIPAVAADQSTAVVADINPEFSDRVSLPLLLQSLLLLLPLIALRGSDANHCRRIIIAGSLSSLLLLLIVVGFATLIKTFLC